MLMEHYFQMQGEVVEPFLSPQNYYNENKVLFLKVRQPIPFVLQGKKNIIKE